MDALVSFTSRPDGSYSEVTTKDLIFVLKLGLFLHKCQKSKRNFFIGQGKLVIYSYYV